MRYLLRRVMKRHVVIAVIHAKYSDVGFHVFKVFGMSLKLPVGDVSAER